MIILRQKNYSWDEFKRASRTIGGGALAGATGGILYSGHRVYRTGKLDKKNALIATGIGAAAGALMGIGVYRAGYKDRLKAKQEKDKFRSEYGMSPEEYFATNLPKGYKEIMDSVCSEMRKLQRSVSLSKGVDMMYICENYLDLEPLDYSKDSFDITDYFIANKNIDLNIIPIASYACVSFGDVFDSGIINYNIKTKKFICNSFSANSLKDILLDLLESIYNFLKEDIEENEEGEDQVNCSREFEIWEKEYYDKAINLIKRIRI